MSFFLSPQNSQVALMQLCDSLDLFKACQKVLILNTTLYVQYAVVELRYAKVEAQTSIKSKIMYVYMYMYMYVYL